MNWKTEWEKLALVVAGFLVCFCLPVGSERFGSAVMEALHLVRWYARDHVLLCLVPAFFIAGAIAVFVSQASVMRYLGARANKVLAYGVASVSGTILAVCSCTVLPLFAGIYRMGAGLGPATTFLYSGPALSLPNMLVIRSVIGTKKTLVFVLLVVVMATISGLTFGWINWVDRFPEEDVMAEQADGEKKDVLIYACSGGANVGEVADRTGRALMAEGRGTMWCLAGLGGSVGPILDRAKKADVNLVLDGCPVDCAKKIFENAGITNFRQIKVTDLGIEKAKGVPVTDEQVAKAVARAREALAAHT